MAANMVTRAKWLPSPFSKYSPKEDICANFPINFSLFKGQPVHTLCGALPKCLRNYFGQFIWDGLFCRCVIDSDFSSVPGINIIPAITRLLALGRDNVLVISIG
ncbi:hypothetical protein AVEN_50145-1 [Araneus ventricosus]|uniref:Uncharacterized protein n=1 Tax=Araneus ventricosus TaxID=182803 RepID=A0A4Y2DAR2_ARAVE|nr:hypothetical protein AVEN_50145-1 [Araneus ventricosus]